MDNPLVKESAYYMDFTCIYDLTWYPFDTHYCIINISLLAQGQVCTNHATYSIVETGPHA
jgi:hypothetical protein